MNEKKDNQTIIPPAKSDEETSIVTPNPVALMPQPLNEEMVVKDKLQKLIQQGRRK